MKRLTVLTATLLLMLSCQVKKDSISVNGEAKPDFGSYAAKPPMGWNSYNCFGGNVTEAEVKANADYMAENLKKYGWEYVVVDFLWYCDDMDSREKFRIRRPFQHIDDYGRLIPSPVLHPSSAGGKGFRPLADYIHSKGLKFGIHIMRGIPHQAISSDSPVRNTDFRASQIANLHDTCIWYGGLTGVNMTKPGAQEYYNSLFELYAEWEVDYIKVDDISYPYHADEIEAVRKAIDNCGRPIVLSLSPGPALIGNPKHLKENVNLWRISGDFWDRWPALVRQLDLCRNWSPLTGPGHWADADMLPLGVLNKRSELPNAKERRTNFTTDEQYFLLTLWSVFRSPLMFGGNLVENDEFTLSLISNEEVIGIDQHSTNNRELSFRNGVSIWTADDTGSKTKYIAVLNTNDTSFSISLPFNEAGISSVESLRDLWKKEDITISGNAYLAEVAPHGARLFAIRP